MKKTALLNEQELLDFLKRSQNWFAAQRDPDPAELVSTDGEPDP